MREIKVPITHAEFLQGKVFMYGNEHYQYSKGVLYCLLPVKHVTGICVTGEFTHGILCIKIFSEIVKIKLLFL